jgi:hypothetical protein
LAWERDVHLDPEHALNDLLWHVHALAVAASYFYAALIWVVTPMVLVWLYRRHPAKYRSARTALVAATGIALLVYLLLPTAPPRMVPGAHFHDVLAETHQWGWWSGQGSDAPRGLTGTANQLAAMPSMHVGWALWSGWLIARHSRHRSVKVLGAIYPLLTAIDVMGTANHYFFDTVGGLVTIGLGVGLTRAVGRFRSIALRPHRSAETAPRSAPRRAPHPSPQRGRPHPYSPQGASTVRLGDADAAMANHRRYSQRQTHPAHQALVQPSESSDLVNAPSGRAGPNGQVPTRCKSVPPRSRGDRSRDQSTTNLRKREDHV